MDNSQRWKHYVKMPFDVIRNSPPIPLDDDDDRDLHGPHHYTPHATAHATWTAPHAQQQQQPVAQAAASSSGGPTLQDLMDKQVELLHEVRNAKEQIDDVMSRQYNLEKSVEDLKTDVERMKTDPCQIEHLKTDVERMKTDLCQILQTHQTAHVRILDNQDGLMARVDALASIVMFGFTSMSNMLPFIQAVGAAEATEAAAEAQETTIEPVDTTDAGITVSIASPLVSETFQASEASELTRINALDLSADEVDEVPM